MGSMLRLMEAHMSHTWNHSVWPHLRVALGAAPAARARMHLYCTLLCLRRFLGVSKYVEFEMTGFVLLEQVEEGFFEVVRDGRAPANDEFASDSEEGHEAVAAQSIEEVAASAAPRPKMKKRRSFTTWESSTRPVFRIRFSGFRIRNFHSESGFRNSEFVISIPN